MTTARTIGLALGVMAILGAGAATVSWAQKAQRDEAESRAQNPSVRDRLSTLEADFEMARLEQEVARSSLIDLLKKCDHLELLQETDSMTAMGPSMEILKAITGEDASKDRSLATAFGLADESQKKEVEAEASKSVKNQFDLLNAAKARRKKDYLEKSRISSAKKIGLTEMMKLHQAEVR